MDGWKTGITTTDEAHIWIHGHDVAGLMRTATFTDIIFLLHRGQLPTNGERRLFDAMLISIADHGPGAPSGAASRMVASANRAAPEAAVAAGILAIGDAHAGAGLACFEILAASLQRAEREGLTPAEAAAAIVTDAKTEGRRLPGFGHRKFHVDPRTVLLFDMATELGLAGRGVALIKEVETSVRTQIKALPINVDGAIAAILLDLGFKAPMAKFLFMIGRVAGLTAQVQEEYSRERPMRIRIPVSYDGPPPRPSSDQAK
jgi:citrate synthase